MSALCFAFANNPELHYLKIHFPVADIKNVKFFSRSPHWAEFQMNESNESNESRDLMT